MMIKFGDECYVDSDSIYMLRKFSNKKHKAKKSDYGFVIAGAGCAYLNEEEFKAILKEVE